MKLTKRDKNLIELLYNNNKNWATLSNLNQINSAYKLTELYPDYFWVTREGHREFVFRINDLGFMPDFLKGK